MTNIDGDESQWKMCFSATDVDLPTGYYFGVTAATGDLAGTTARKKTYIVFVQTSVVNSQTTTMSSL